MFDWGSFLAMVAAGGLGGATSLLVHNSLKLARISQALTDHTRNEEEWQGKIARRLKRVERKLPNGEVEKMFRMISELYQETTGKEVPKSYGGKVQDQEVHSDGESS